MAIYLCNVRPAQTFYPLTIGTILETTGLAVLTWATSVRNTSVVNGMLVLAGAGTGMRFMPCTLHTSGVWPERLAPAMSLMRFALPFGGTLCLTIMGSVFSNKFTLPHSPGAASGSGVISSPNSLGFIAHLPPTEQSAVRTAGKEAVMWAFISIMPFMGVSMVTGLFLGNVWIRKRMTGNDEENKEKGRDVVDDGIASSEVIYVPFLWALVKVCVPFPLSPLSACLTDVQGVNKYKHTSKPLSEIERQYQAHTEREMRELNGR